MIATHVFFVGADPVRISLFRQAFGLPGAEFATHVAGALRLIDQNDVGTVMAVDAAAPWVRALVGTVGEEGIVAVLVLADERTVALVPELLRAGADAFVLLPAKEAELTVAAETARASRGRRLTAQSEIVAARAQLMRFADDFREGYRREKDKALALAVSLEQLEATYRDTARALAAAVEAKDLTTGRHIERVTALASVLAAHVAPELAADPALAFGFLLHDLGKIGVPDTVLRKPGPLSPEEMELMRLHTEIGSRIVRDIEFLDPVRGIIRHHHERWDGDGYPDKLQGDAIPLAARIFSVADAADAMLHDRPYRRALPFDRVREEIAQGAGSQFDPEVVKAFLALIEAGEVESADQPIGR